MAEEERQKHAGGRPPMFTTAEAMQILIDKYFEDCKGRKYLDKDGLPVICKSGFLYDVEPEPYTITGLALALGFNSRLSLLNYEGKEEFVNTIRTAKARVERYAEVRLYDSQGANGAKFSLSNNYKGWAEKQETDINLKGSITLEQALKDMQGDEF